MFHGCGRGNRGGRAGVPRLVEEVTVRQVLAAAAVAAFALVGCGGDPAATEADERTVRVEFELRGGCGMTPDGCPDPRVIEDVADINAQAATALLAADLDPLRRVDPGELGCGDAAVDGVGLHVTVHRTLGEHLPAFEEATLCLTAADDTLTGVPELRRLYGQRR